VSAQAPRIATTWRDFDDREAREASIAADLAADSAQLAAATADTW